MWRLQNEEDMIIKVLVTPPVNPTLRPAEVIAGSERNLEWIVEEGEKEFQLWT